MIGFGVDLSNLKKNFFDRKAVMDAADKATRKVLSKFGAFVRTRSRTSIKKTDRVSAPGSPPSSHDPHLLRSFILFSYEPLRRSVVIGPAKVGGKIGNAPQALEEGGDSEAWESFWVGAGPGRQRRRRLVKTTVRARPFMVPAFNAELPGVPALWANSIT